MTSEKLQKNIVQVASQEDIVALTAKVRDKRLVYRPITKDDGHWGPVTEQRTLRTTTIDLLTGEILGHDAPCILGESCQCGCDDCCVGVQGTAARMSQETVAAQDMLPRFAQ